MASNRDLPDTRRARFLTGYNPDAVADDTLLVGRITADDGRILATLVNLPATRPRWPGRTG